MSGNSEPRFLYGQDAGMTNIRTTVLMIGLMLWISFGRVHAETQIRITPFLNVSQSYEDNIDLEKTNTKSDYIIVVSPGIKLLGSTKNSRLKLDYSPGFSYYAKYNEYNTVRHRADLDYFYRWNQKFQFNLRDQYHRTEDVFELPQDDLVQGIRIRNGRNTVDTNEAVASLDYRFGPEDKFTVGYRHRLLWNQDPRYNDVEEHEPFAELDYWIDKRNGMRLGYRHVRGIYDTRVDQPLTLYADDYDGYRADGRYIFRFDPRTSIYTRYAYITRNFDRVSSEDYHVHEAAFGVDHALSRRASLFAEGGYFWKKREQGPQDSVEGYILGVGWNQRFEYGTFQLGVQHGWDDGLLEEEVRGFTRYWSYQARVSRQFTQYTEAYAGGLVRTNDYELKEDETIAQGGVGVSARLKQWLYMTLGVDHRRLISDEHDKEYQDNRVFILLSAEATRPYIFGTKVHGNSP